MNRIIDLLYIVVSTAIALWLTSCMDYGPRENERFEVGSGPSGAAGQGLFIANEGNFMYGNASLSYYDPATKTVQNEVFVRANGIPLGDVAQSMVIREGMGWIVVNNSGVIFAIDINTFRIAGKITGFTSPRYIHFLSDEKAYVTQLWDDRICIVNPRTFEITGYIHTGMAQGSESTEQMIQYGRYLFITCWSNNDRILVIDTETDKITDEIKTGIQPSSIVLDYNNKIWTITDGGNEGSSYGHDTPALYRIDPATRHIEREFKFQPGDSPSEVVLNGTRDTLYFINNDVWQMPVDAGRLPASPFIESRNTIYYGLTVNPANSEVYVSDAIDHVQPGVISRYSPKGELIDEFKTGTTPGAFCWR